MHYGFIVLEKMSLSVKDILLKRDLASTELEYIKSKIAKLHSQGIIHGDLKPSNIGANLDGSGQIKLIRILDWAKGTYTHDRDKIARDMNTFTAHIRKNIAERK